MYLKVSCSVEEEGLRFNVLERFHVVGRRGEEGLRLNVLEGFM